MGVGTNGIDGPVDHLFPELGVKDVWHLLVRVSPYALPIITHLHTQIPLSNLEVLPIVKYTIPHSYV